MAAARESGLRYADWTRAACVASGSAIRQESNMSRLLRALLLIGCLLPGGVKAGGSIEVALLTGNPGGIVAPGREANLALLLTNTSVKPVQGDVVATLTEFDGAQEKLSQHVLLPSRGKVRLKLPLGAGRLGIRTVDYQFNGEQAVRGRASFVYGKPAGAGPDPAGFLYGVCGHLSRDSLQEAATQAAAVSQIGVRVLRMGREWAALESQPGKWNWADLDARVGVVEHHGLQIQMLLAYGNVYAASAEAQTAAAQAKAAGEQAPWIKAVRAPPEDGAWRAYVRSVVTRYRGRIHYWEIWNEPDLSLFFLGRTDDYIRMLRSAYAEVKRVDPRSKIMTAGFATVDDAKYRRLNPDLQQRVLAEASDAFDIHALHEHGTFEAFEHAVDGELTRYRSGMKQPRPLYFNETGMSSQHGREREQALALVKKITFARARGAIAYNWYDIRDDGTDPDELEHNFGLLTRDFQPKPAYAAYNELITRLRGLKFSSALEVGAARHGYVFDAPGRKVIVVWADKAARGQQIAIVTNGAGTARQLDIMGNAKPLAIARGEVLITLQDEPSYVEFRGSPKSL